MDFMTLSKDRHGYDSVFVMVDRLSKRSYTMPCHKKTDAAQAARLFFNHVWPHTGTPETLTSDRGTQFVSEFWDELCKILGIKMQLTTARHPETDGQTEIMNQYLTQRLRPMVNYAQDDWSELLPFVDMAQACLPHESTGLSPFMIETGCEPRMSYDWNKRTTEFDSSSSRMTRQAAQEYAARIHAAWETTKGNMKRAQERQAKNANRKRRPVDFNIGDFVYVDRRGRASDRPSEKLNNPWAGPFKIVDQKGSAFELDLPAAVKVHRRFHPSKLRKADNNPLSGQNNPEPEADPVDGEIRHQVGQVLMSRIRSGKLQYRVDWDGADEDFNWYNAGKLKRWPHKLRQFHEANPTAPGPPYNLKRWIEMLDNDEGLPADKLSDDSPATPPSRKGTKRTKAQVLQDIRDGKL